MKKSIPGLSISFLSVVIFSAGFGWPAQARAEQFNIVVLPDTQYYSQDWPDIFSGQTAWIRDSQQTTGPANTIYIAHLGDLVEDCEADLEGGNPVGTTAEWVNADDAMETLRGLAIPYSVLPGNHDYDRTAPGNQSCSDATERTVYNFYFGPDSFSGENFYGGNWDGTNDNNYTLFESPDGLKFIAINFAYTEIASDATNGDGVTLIDWADALLKANPDRLAILTAHFFLKSDGARDCSGNRPADGSPNLGPFGSAVLSALDDNPNLFLMLSGHCLGEGWDVLERDGSLGDINLILSDYQAYEDRQSGYFRTLTFDTVANSISVETLTEVAGIPAAQFVTSSSAMGVDSVTDFVIEFDEEMYLPESGDTPLAFPFASVSGALPSSTILSDTVTIQGIDTAAISIEGGEYAIGDSEEFTGEDGQVSNGQSVQVRLFTEDRFDFSSVATLTVGTVSETFEVTTMSPTGDGFDEVSYSTGIDNATISNVLINGSSNPGPIAPGSIVDVRANYSVYIIPGPPHCPACIVQLQLGFEGASSGECLFNRVPSRTRNPPTVGTGTVRLMAPDSAGPHYLAFRRTLQYECINPWNVPLPAALGNDHEKWRLGLINVQ